jgi:hypothetical protein
VSRNSGLARYPFPTGPAPRPAERVLLSIALTLGPYTSFHTLLLPERAGTLKQSARPALQIGSSRAHERSSFNRETRVQRNLFRLCRGHSVKASPVYTKECGDNEALTLVIASLVRALPGKGARERH